MKHIMSILFTIKKQINQIFLKYMVLFLFLKQNKKTKIQIKLYLNLNKKTKNKISYTIKIISLIFYTVLRDSSQMLIDKSYFKRLFSIL